MPAVVHVDAAALLAAHLRAELPDNDVDGPVVTSVPDPRPDAFTLVRRVGGVGRNLVTDGATVTVECWADNEHTAVARAQMARAILHDLPGTSLDGHPVYRVIDIAGPAMLPDPESHQPRCTLTLEVWVRGTT